MNEDLHVFMVCEELNLSAFGSLPPSYFFRHLSQEEVPLWIKYPFDGKELTPDQRQFMSAYIAKTYDNNLEKLCQNTWVVNNQQHEILATCTRWKAYGVIQSIQWLKTKKEYEGQGIGRALLTKVLRSFTSDDFPVFLHTQSGSYKAIKLYSDFGFSIITDELAGPVPNQWEDALSVLKPCMKKEAFNRLHYTSCPKMLKELLADQSFLQF